MENPNQNITSDLKISELKQSNLYKSYEQFHSQASSMLVFGVQWKDLETHFDSTRKSLQTSLETLSEREKAVSLREKELTTRESLFESDFELKTKEFERIEELIGESLKENELAKRHADSLQTLIVENSEELEVKEKEFKAIEKSIAEKNCELDRVKGTVEEEEKKLERVKNCVEVSQIHFFSLAKKVKQKAEEVSSKEREVDSLRGSLRGYKNDIVSEERKFNAIRRNVEERKKEVESKEEQIRACKSSIDELNKEIQLKDDKLKAVLSSIANCSSELESKERKLDSVRKEFELKERSFVSLKNSADQIAQVFEKREREIEGLLKEFELKEKLFESKLDEYNLIRNKVDDCLKGVESREKNLESLENSLKKCYGDLETKESLFKKQVIEFESKQKKSDSSRNPTEVRNPSVTATTQSQVMKVEPLEYSQNYNAIVISSASNPNLCAMEGKDLQLFLNRHLKTHDSVCDKVFAILKASNNPPKLALDAMEGLYPSDSSVKSREFGMSVVRRSCILILEQLEKLIVRLPRIGSEVREEAKRFAKNWRVKMKETDTNYMEALGFLQFLTSFRLTSDFDPNEIYQLTNIISQQRHSPDLRQALSTADKTLAIPKIEQAAENSLASLMTRPPIVEVNTMLSICMILQKSPDPAKYVLQYIQGLFSQPWMIGSSGAATNVLRNCIILFDQLLKTSPHIQPPLREDAMKVAADWKANIEAKGDSTLDILVFLQFLDTYGLVPSSDKDEIVKFLKKISRDDEVLDVCRQIGIAKGIPDLIQYLIQKKNFVDAVRLTCAFKLVEKFDPVKLLTKYMEDLKDFTTKNCKGVRRPIEEKEKFGDEEITALIAVRECVIEYYLDLSLGQINTRIDVLEQTKIQRRRSAETARIKAEREERSQPPHQQRNDKRGRGFTHEEQSRHKFPRPVSPVRQYHCSPGFVSPREYSSDIHYEPAPPVPRRQFYYGGSSDMGGPYMDGCDSRRY